MPSVADDGAAPSPIERIVFFGTPVFAVPTLDALAGAGRTPILVVSQPSRAAGRGHENVFGGYLLIGLLTSVRKKTPRLTIG